MRKIVLISVAGAAAVIPAAVAAKAGDPAGTAYSVGKCIVRADRAVAAALLRELPLTGGETELAPARLGAAAKCAAGQGATVSTTLLRGGLAQALLLKDFPRFGVQPEIAQSRFVRYDLPIDGPTAGVDAQTASMYRLADCVVRNQAIKTEVLFRSSPGSSHEGRVFEAMAPYVSACHGAGNDLRIGRAEFRSMMAQAAYNVSVRYWTGDLWSAK